MTKRKPDLGSTYPVGHPSGRIWQPPASVEQARARVLAAMDGFEDSCRIGLDVGYATRILDEAEDDYREMVVTGEVDEGRTAAIEAEVKELAAEIAEAQAEAIVLEAIRRHLDGGGTLPTEEA